MYHTGYNEPAKRISDATHFRRKVMSRKMPGDGRIQEMLQVVFDLRNKDKYTNQERARIINRKTLRNCTGKFIESLDGACRALGMAGLTCGNGDVTVGDLINQFIEIRRKQSPGYATGQIDLDPEIRKLLAEIGASPVVRRPGMATPAEGLKEWTTEKVASEIGKQIRRDFGGKNGVSAVNWMMARWKITLSVAESMYNWVGVMIEGCRKRVASKVEELVRRIKELEGKVKELEKLVKELRGRIGR
jgi:hypothetical protein